MFNEGPLTMSQKPKQMWNLGVKVNKVICPRV